MWVHVVLVSPISRRRELPLAFVWSKCDSCAKTASQQDWEGEDNVGRAEVVLAVGVLAGSSALSFGLPTAASSLKRPQRAVPSAVLWSSSWSPCTRSWLRYVMAHSASRSLRWEQLRAGCWCACSRFFTDSVWGCSAMVSTSLTVAPCKDSPIFAQLIKLPLLSLAHCNISW